MFGDIPDEVMAIIHDINTYAITNKGKSKLLPRWEKMKVKDWNSNGLKNQL